jgi:glyoxylase-like metal-dependent hydrolase (beta-lactamase superfamily II)
MVRHMELAAGVHQLTVQPGINCWALVEEQGTTLVDAGLHRPGLLKALTRLGVAPSDVTRVLLTHGHPDHVGGVARLRRAGGGAEVRVGEGDHDLVVGRASQPGADPDHPVGRLRNRLPDPPGFGPPPPVPDARALEDGEVLPIAGGLEVVATPGHTPGHLAFRLPAHDLVIGGDALFNYFRLRPCPAWSCWRIPLNRTSVERLAGLAPRTLALAHGRPVTGDVEGRLRQLLAES